MAVVTRPNQRPGIVLAAERAAALIKARDWIAVQTKSQDYLRTRRLDDDAREEYTKSVLVATIRS